MCVAFEHKTNFTWTMKYIVSIKGKHVQREATFISPEKKTFTLSTPTQVN